MSGTFLGYLVIAMVLLVLWRLVLLVLAAVVIAFFAQSANLLHSVLQPGPPAVVRPAPAGEPPPVLVEVAR